MLSHIPSVKRTARLLESRDSSAGRRARLDDRNPRMRSLAPSRRTRPHRRQEDEKESPL